MITAMITVIDHRDVDVSAGDLFANLARLIAARSNANTRPPRRFTRLSWPLQPTDIRAADLASPPGGIETPLPFGVRPDTGELLWIDPMEDGVAFRFLGAPKSGRSNALIALGLLAQQAGWSICAAAASRRSPMWSSDVCKPWLVPVDELIDQAERSIGGPTLVLVDDAHRLDDEFPWKRLAQIESGPTVTVVAGPVDGLTKPQFTRGLGAVGGVMFMPVRPRDASQCRRVDRRRRLGDQPAARHRHRGHRGRSPPSPIPPGACLRVAEPPRRVLGRYSPENATRSMCSWRYGARGTRLAVTMACHTSASS